MIKLRDVSYHYGSKPVLKDISFDVNESEFLGIIGPNGSGKTTLLRIIAGFFEPAAGCTLLHDNNILRLKKKQRAQQIAVVSQYHMVNQYYTVKQLIQMGREPHLSFLKRLKNEDHKLIEHIVSKLDLQDMQDRLVRSLSGGELQRVLIAKALIQDTPILLMDEPTNHLDVHHQIKVLDLLRAHKRAGKTIVTVFHDLSFAARYSDRILVLNNELEMIGKPAEILNAEMMQKVFKTDDYLINKDLRVVLK